MEGIFILLITGLVAGALNAAAGGGSFITMPAMVYAGLPALEANTSSTAALFPGTLASAIALKKDIRPIATISLKNMILITLIGGCIGAVLILITPTKSFNILIPWLLLTGSIAFAFGRKLGELLRKKFYIGTAVLVICQFLLGLYGGYFGGAVGIMMMAVWHLFGVNDIKIINANKTLFVAVANTIAVILFIVAGKICWSQTLIMMTGTVVGGYFGAKYIRKINPYYLRTAIIVVNFVITALFFFNAYQ